MVDPTADLVVTDTFTIPGRELRWHFSRSSGPGGQSVNTSDSRVELRWDPRTSTAVSGVAKDRLRAPFVVVASEHRSQLQNRQAARHRLAQRVASALAGPRKRRRRTKPTGASVTRRMQAKRQRSALKATRRRPAVE